MPTAVLVRIRPLQALEWVLLNTDTTDGNVQVKPDLVRRNAEDISADQT